MLIHTVETVERSSKKFRKIVLLEGAKFYGAHLGPYKSQLERPIGGTCHQTSIYNQEDYLQERSKGKLGHGQLCDHRASAVLRLGIR